MNDEWPWIRKLAPKSCYRSNFCNQKTYIFSELRNTFPVLIFALSICFSHLRFNLEFCSHIWEAAPTTAIYLLEANQKNIIKLFHLNSWLLTDQRTVGDLSFFSIFWRLMFARIFSYNYFTFCSSKNTTKGSSSMVLFTTQL